MGKGIYPTNKAKYRNIRPFRGSEGDPVIFRDISFEVVQAITVFVGKNCGYKTITPELMVFTVAVLRNMCDKGGKK